MEDFPPDYKPACPMYKNQLQELVQKAGLSLPIYQSVNEGYDHAPKFRASVLVDKTKYTSESTFPDQKAAEQDVAKLALESLKNTTLRPELGPFLVHQKPAYCKSILHEYAVKMNLPIPKYQTIPMEGPRAVFESCFEFGGKTYTSREAESKKMAEQLAAKAAIQSLLTSDAGPLYKVIQAKEKLLASLYTKKNSDNEGTSKFQPETIREHQASIQAEIIIDNAGHGAFHGIESGIKRQQEFKAGMQDKFQNTAGGINRLPEFNTGVQNNFPITGSGIKRQPEFKAGVQDKFQNTDGRINRQPEFTARVQNNFPITGSGIKRQPEFKVGVQDKFQNTGGGINRLPEFTSGVQNKFPITGSGIKRQPDFSNRVQNKFPNTGSGMKKKQLEIGIGVQNKYPCNGNGNRRQAEFRTGVQNRFPNAGRESRIKRHPESNSGPENMNQSYGRSFRKQP